MEANYINRYYDVLFSYVNNYATKSQKYMININFKNNF